MAEKLRIRRYTVHEEFPIGGGKTIDLVAEKGGNRIAIEIETGKSDVESKIQKCFANGFKDIRVSYTKNIDFSLFFISFTTTPNQSQSSELTSPPLELYAIFNQ